MSSRNYKGNINEIIQKGELNGVASLDGDGKVPLSQLPSIGNYLSSSDLTSGDFDDITDIGFYTLTTDFTEWDNGIEELFDEHDDINNPAVLSVIGNGNDIIKQEITTISGRIFVRIFNGSDWFDWKELLYYKLLEGEKEAQMFTDENTEVIGLYPDGDE